MRYKEACMSDRRMFAKSIVMCDAFLDMPATARCLYFTLSMMADDDGFVDNPKSIMRQCQSTEDDLKILLAKQFLLSFENGLIVIKDWRINNYLRSDRYKQTVHVQELRQLAVEQNNSYVKSDKPVLIEAKKKFVKPTIEEVQAYITEKNYSINASDFIDFYESKGWMVGRNPMKDWRASVRTWERRKKEDNKGYQTAVERSGVDKITEEDLKRMDF